MKQIRVKMRLPDDCPIPEFIYFSGITESTEVLEKYYFEKLRIIYEEQR